jgi:hypothetical protein
LMSPQDAGLSFVYPVNSLDDMVSFVVGRPKWILLYPWYFLLILMALFKSQKCKKKICYEFFIFLYTFKSRSSGLWHRVVLW